MKEFVKKVEEYNIKQVKDFQLNLRNILTNTQALVITNFITYILKDDNVNEDFINQISFSIFESIKETNVQIKSIISDSYEIIKYKKIPFPNYNINRVKGVQFNINQEINQKCIPEATIILISNEYNNDKVEEINDQRFHKSILKICNRHRIKIILIQCKISQDLLNELSKINVICVRLLRFIL